MRRIGAMVTVGVSTLCLFALIFTVSLGSTTRINGSIVFGTANPDSMRYGVNYLSTHWHYDPYYLSDEELDRDFQLFKEKGLEYITLMAVWKYLEPSLGVYNDAGLSDLKRVCDFAAKYGLNVIVDFHTMMHEDSFTMPTWLSPRKFETVFTNGTVRAAWLSFLDYCATFLNDIGNIHSWHMMNEPAIGEWACDVTVDEFLELWNQMRNIFKSRSEKPVSIRFGANTFDKHFNRDPRIYDVCDYVALNWYEELCSRERLVEIVAEISKHKTVVISEFGYETDDDTIQADFYSQYLQLFKDIGLKDCIAMFWRADYESPNPPPPGKGFNLAKNLNGEPRPAFCLMDTVPPTISIESPQNTTYSMDSVPLAFQVTEQTQWVGYSLDQQDNTTLSGNTTISSLSDGIHTLTLCGNDTIGNMGLSETVYFTIDTTPPQTDIDLGGTLGLEDWYVSDVVVTLTATDALSDVATTQYSFNYIDWTAYTDSIIITDEGLTRIYCRSTDTADNIENSRIAIVKIDKSAPSTLTVSSPTHPNPETWYPNHQPAFEWTTPSDLSGIAGYSYNLNQVSSFTPDESVDTSLNAKAYTGVSAGTWYFHIRAVDRAGNWGSTVHFSVRISCSILFESGQDNGATSDFGTVKINGAQAQDLPFTVTRAPGTLQVTYEPTSSYTFHYWETTGGLQVANPYNKTAAVTITNDGSIKAVYRAFTLFSDRFESASFGAWSGTAGTRGERAIVSSLRFHHGKYGARFTSNSGGSTEYAYCYKTISSSTDLYARAYFYVSQSGIIDSGDRFYFIAIMARNSDVACAGWRKNGNRVQWCLAIRNVGGYVYAYSADSPTLNRWYCVELHWKKDAAKGAGELWIDGRLVCTIPGKNTAYFGDANQVRFGLPQITNCASTTAHCDCAKIAKTYIGPES